MRLMCLRWLACLAVVMALTAPLRAQSFGFPWWRDARFQHDLALTPEQATRIENLFQSTIGQLRDKKADLDQQEDQLSRMIAANADEGAIIKQVDRVEAIRANLNKMRTLQLVHIRQMLTPEQLKKLNTLHEHWERDHPRDGRDGRDGRPGRGRGKE